MDDDVKAISNADTAVSAHVGKNKQYLANTAYQCPQHENRYYCFYLLHAR